MKIFLLMILSVALLSPHLKAQNRVPSDEQRVLSTTIVEDRNLPPQGSVKQLSASLAILNPTPSHPLLEGKHYPDVLPVDRDNDLLFVRSSAEPAEGQVTHLSGKVLSTDGAPIRNALVEIWHADSKGFYLEQAPSAEESRDERFQGYGRCVTGVEGRYYFRTIKPCCYTHSGIARAPHINIVISVNGRRIFTSQMLIKDDPSNRKDGFFIQLEDAKQRKQVVAEFKPIENSQSGELMVSFNIVISYQVDQKIPSISSQVGGAMFQGEAGYTPHEVKEEE